MTTSRVLVTGGAHRLGGAIAKHMAARGAHVAVHYFRSVERATELQAEVTIAGGASPVLLQGDLQDAAFAEALPDMAANELGGLDVVVNSAAVLERQPFGSVAPADWDRVVNVNLRAYFFVAQAAAPHLRPTGGSLINISDIAAFDTWPDYAPHCIAKAGVEALTRLLAYQMGPEVRVNGIAPGAVLVPEGWSDQRRDRRAARSPLGRLGAVMDVVRAVDYLLGAEYVTGTTLIVDGGQLVRPRDDLGV